MYTRVRKRIFIEVSAAALSLPGNDTVVLVQNMLTIKLEKGITLKYLYPSLVYTRGQRYKYAFRIAVHVSKVPLISKELFFMQLLAH